MAGALPSEEYRSKLERAGFRDVTVTITKPYALNMEVARSAFEDPSSADYEAMEGISASALITALR